MARKKLFTVTDLGGGDGGKGGVVHKICTFMKAHTVIKVGGAQGSHGVRTSRGDAFNFSQFGCGALEGTQTYVSKNFVVDPLGLMYEGELLKYGCGIRNIFDTITIDQNALCVTPFHRIMSQLRELMRRDNPRGTVGTGVGEAFADREKFPEFAIHIKDIGKPQLRKMLAEVREQKLYEAPPLMLLENFLENDREHVRWLFDTLHDPAVVEVTAYKFEEMAQLVKIADTEYLKNKILSRDGVVVVESSHGVLTDKYHGFHPHTSKLRTVPAETTFNLLEECGYDGEVVKLGVTRAYQIRHGAGPMVTENSSMLENLLPGSHKDENRWQGRVRVGPLDFVALRYTVNVCGGAEAFDGIAVTWFDQIVQNGVWNICVMYGNTEDQEFFDKDEIHVRRGADQAQLAHQEKLGELLRMCRPNVMQYPILSAWNQERLVKLCEHVFTDNLGVPISMISFGPTEEDKVCL